MVVTATIRQEAGSQSEDEKLRNEKLAEALRNLSKSTGAQIDRLLSSVDLQARAYQRRIVHSAIEMFAGSFRPNEFGLQCETSISGQARCLPAAKSVLIESPTGSGKTVMGLATAAILQRATGLRIGWVAMRRNLLKQAENENRSRGFHVDLQLMSMFDKHPPSVDLLIVDEAQHDAATSMANLHSRVRPKWTLGLSATPYRTDRIKLCFDQVIRDAGIASLIADGFLSSYHHYTIPQYSPEFLGRLLIEQQQRWGKSLVFFHRRQECNQLQHILAEKGIASDVVTASSDRDRQLDDFRSGKTHVLINMAILTEGFDCPELQTVFCRPSGRGCTIQMAGRVLRISDSVPSKQIVQCQKTRWPMHRTAMPVEQYLWSDERWLSIRANQRLDQLTEAARNRVAQAEVQLPKLVSMHRRRSNAWYSTIEE